MKQLRFLHLRPQHGIAFLLLTSLLGLASCDGLHNDNWQSYYQEIGVQVTGGSADEAVESPFGGAFGDDFHYNVSHSSLYWGDEGAAINQHYTPYSVGATTKYYRGSESLSGDE